MIQRIQSVFLFLTIVCVAGVLIFPIWIKEDPSSENKEKVVLNAYYFTHFEENMPPGRSSGAGDLEVVSETAVFYIAGAAGLSIIIAFFSLLGYKNRMRQIKLNALNALILVGILGGSVYFITKGERMIAPDLRGAYDFGFYAVIAAALFNLLANRFIRKDEQLVRSSDRMR